MRGGESLCSTKRCVHLSLGCEAVCGVCAHMFAGGNGGSARCKVPPEVVARVYEEWVMPLTKEVEVQVGGWQAGSPSCFSCVGLQAGSRKQGNVGFRGGVTGGTGAGCLGGTCVVLPGGSVGQGEGGGEEGGV